MSSGTAGRRFSPRESYFEGYSQLTIGLAIPMALSMELDCASCRGIVVGGMKQRGLHSTTMFLTRECADDGLGLSVPVRPSMPVPGFTTAYRHQECRFQLGWATPVRNDAVFRTFDAFAADMND